MEPSATFQCTEVSIYSLCVFSPLASKGHDQYCRRKLRHTTHIEGFPSKVTILRDHHPLQGQSLEVFSRLHRNGSLNLTLILPDGSRSLIPAAWTDLDMTPVKTGQTLPPDNRPSTSATLGSLSHLLHARKVVDSLLHKLDASEQATLIPSKEERKRATPTRPLARSGKTAPGADPLGRTRPQHSKKDHRHPVQVDQQGGLSKNSGGQP